MKGGRGHLCHRGDQIYYLVPPVIPRLSDISSLGTVHIHGHRHLLTSALPSLRQRSSTTGCHTGTDIKFTVNARPQEHFHTSHIWQNLPYTCTFWICICKNFEAFPIFFKIGRNFDAHILKTAKIHRKLKIKQTSVLFYKYFLNESSDLYEIWDFYSWGSKELSNDFS